jgi:hypothetical protein
MVQVMQPAQKSKMKFKMVAAMGLNIIPLRSPRAASMPTKNHENIPIGSKVNGGGDTQTETVTHQTDRARQMIL